MTNKERISLSLHDSVVQAKGNLVSDMNGEKVMMSIGSGKYYNLGQIGGRIWELIEAQISVEQLVSLLVAEYDIEQALCEVQTTSFLEQMIQEGLIEVQGKAKVNS